MKIRINADMMNSDMKRIKIVGKVVTVKRKKVVPAKTVGYYFDYKGKKIYIPKKLVTEI